MWSESYICHAKRRKFPVFYFRLAMPGQWMQNSKRFVPPQFQDSVHSYQHFYCSDRPGAPSWLLLCRMMASPAGTFRAVAARSNPGLSVYSRPLTKRVLLDLFRQPMRTRKVWHDPETKLVGACATKGSCSPRPLRKWLHGSPKVRKR